MLIHDLTAAQCRAILGKASIGRLGCALANQPYIVPVSLYFDAEEDCLYSFSTLGRKIEWMRHNPMVCVEVDEIVDHLRWTTVVVFGRYEEVPNSADLTDARRRALELFQQRQKWWLPATGRRTSGEEHHVSVLYRIRISRITGRRAGPSAD